MQLRLKFHASPSECAKDDQRIPGYQRIGRKRKGEYEKRTDEYRRNEARSHAGAHAARSPSVPRDYRFSGRNGVEVELDFRPAAERHVYGDVGDSGISALLLPPLALIHGELEVPSPHSRAGVISQNDVAGRPTANRRRSNDESRLPGIIDDEPSQVEIRVDGPLVDVAR